MSYSSDRLLLSNQRERQVSRFRAWVTVGAPLAAILFQVYVPMFFQFLSFLELPLLVMIYFALMRRSQITGLLIGAVRGLGAGFAVQEPAGNVRHRLRRWWATSRPRSECGSTWKTRSCGHCSRTSFLSFISSFYWVMTRALLAQQVAFRSYSRRLWSGC